MVQSVMPSENRREARVDARLQVLVIRGRRTIPLETGDVSFKGLFVKTDDPPPLRSLVRLRVILPLGQIEAHAMVVHVAAPDEDGQREVGAGVQFWGLAGPDRRLWDDFVRELLQVRRALAKRVAASTEVEVVTVSPESGFHTSSSSIEEDGAGKDRRPR